MNDDEKLYFWEKPSPEDVMHYGVLHRSGRYPWGSGDDPYQHGSSDFKARVEELRKQNITFTDANGKTWTGDSAIALTLGIDPKDMRAAYSLAKDDARMRMYDSAVSMHEHGMSNGEIAKQLGLPNESSVRSLLNADANARMNVASNTAEFLKAQVDANGNIDIGKGINRELNVSQEKLDEATYLLKCNGYTVYNIRQAQPTNPGQYTTYTLLCPPGTEYKDAYNQEVHYVTDYISKDGGDTFTKAFEYPASMDSSRLQIKYAEDGGIDKDGLIEIRRGCQDLDLGESHYAQVRIMVDGKKYIKGMAIYSDDLPDGCDVRFNTNKTKDVAKMDVLKDIKKDPDNPFGSLIKDQEHGGQYHYIDKDGNEKLGLINKTRAEGDWTEWSDKLPSQFLSKQNTELIKQQLTLTENNTKAEFDAINSLTNPTVKKALLDQFANTCDKTSVTLKAAALPRQKYKVILPIDSMKDDEIYAPSYENGEKVALVRYPHGGTFEIPILTVNNKQPDAKRTLGNAIDAVGINAKVAGRLSGADFDGDTVTVIPTAGNGKNLHVKITSTPPLKGLEGFDPKLSYGADSKPKVDADGTKHYFRNGREYKLMTNTQNEMGKISNLITDMTLKGADEAELARAVRHSMVVIDAEKHHLDYTKSYEDNDISSLKKKYQGHINETTGKENYGASTLLTRAKSEVRLPYKIVGTPKVNKETGELEYKTKEETYTDKNGKVKIRDTKTTAMAVTKDAYSLSSGTLKENLYAEYANYMKNMANQARLAKENAGNIAYSKEAKAKYQKEVESLNRKLRIAQSNAPKERQAISIANVRVKAKWDILKNDPDISTKDAKKQIKKVKQQELTRARNIVGAHKTKISISSKEWEAIQAGAISESKLRDILNNTDMDKVREMAMPKSTPAVSAVMDARIQSMSNAGYTISEISNMVGVSTSTVSEHLK